MFALLKLIQSIIRTLHSDGAAGPGAAGIRLTSLAGDADLQAGSCGSPQPRAA